MSPKASEGLEGPGAIPALDTETHSQAISFTRN